MRTKAVTQCVLGLASGCLTIAGGLYQGVASTRALNSGLDGAQLMARSAAIQGYGQVYGGGSKLIDAASQFAGTWMDAKNVELKGDQEEIRMMRERLESLDQSMKELIQKVNQTNESIVQSTREMRNRILA